MTVATVKGPWDAERVARYLSETVVPVRLACLGGEGWPIVLSLWFEHDEGGLWCATHESSRLAEHLRRDDRVAFEVAPSEPPYAGVRGRGRVTIDPARGEEVLRRLLRRYLGGEDSDLARWLLSRAEGELAIRIEPVSIFTWDYTDRMRGAG